MITCVPYTFEGIDGDVIINLPETKWWSCGLSRRYRMIPRVERDDMMVRIWHEHQEIPPQVIIRGEVLEYLPKLKYHGDPNPLLPFKEIMDELVHVIQFLMGGCNHQHITFTNTPPDSTGTSSEEMLCVLRLGVGDVPFEGLQKICFETMVRNIIQNTYPSENGYVFVLRGESGWGCVVG